MDKVQVFITDAEYKHTLAAVRALGKKGMHITAGSFLKMALSFYSKFCNDHIIYPDPRNENEFARFMLKYVKENNIDVLLAIGNYTNIALSHNKLKFIQYTKLPIVDWPMMKIASNKQKTMEYADKIGITIPRTYKNSEEIDNYPVVVKGKSDVGKVQYINSYNELTKINTSNSIIQEYIPGTGYGFYALFNEGDIRAYFMHKRLREYPITGGPSTAAESVYDSQLKTLGLKLLNALNWHGVAMVEFKKDIRDGKFKLMEINPKFWGSLDLSIASGVNFPYLTVKMALDGDVKRIFKYKKGVRFRWLFPDDVRHLLAQPKSTKDFFNDFFDNNTMSNVWWSDIKPNLFQLLYTFPVFIYRLKGKKFRYPHGIPKVKF